ncbi:hypothetical protein [Streptomyces acidiscabies]|uniref:hypothetical protein n=1 Tax=Streptomyces acidiscabies TaxID=42234 RepID=UPI000952AD3B|nr:hypothetical protein [Streptomyces acidiscabies]
MGAAKEPAEDGSPVAGACVLIVLGGVAVAAAFAVDEAAGILTVVTAGTVALWRSARRMSDSSATPPPREGRPSCRECAGHTLLSVTPLAGRKGMSIYTSAPPDRPAYTHVHIAEEATDR